MAYENFDTRDVTYQIGVMRAHQEGRQIVAQRRRRCGNQKNEEPKACSVPRWNWDDWEYFIRDEETAIRPHANELARMVIAAAEGFLHGKTIERCRWDDKKWAVVIPIDWDWTNYCYRVRPNEVPEQAQENSPFCRTLYIGPIENCENYLLAIPEPQRICYFIDEHEGQFAVFTASPELGDCACADSMSLTCPLHDDIPF